jgi:hypothetical protein
MLHQKVTGNFPTFAVGPPEKETAAPHGGRDGGKPKERSAESLYPTLGAPSTVLPMVAEARARDHAARLQLGLAPVNWEARR